MLFNVIVIYADQPEFDSDEIMDDKELLKSFPYLKAIVKKLRNDNDFFCIKLTYGLFSLTIERLNNG